MTASALVGQIIMGPLANGVTRFYAPSKEINKLHYYFKTLVKLRLYASLFVLLVMVLTVIICLIIGKVVLIPILIVAFLFSIVSGNNQILSGVQNAARQRTIVALHQGIGPWVRFLMAICLIIFFGSSSLVALIGYTLGIGIVYFSQNIFFKKIIQICPSTNEYSKQEETHLQKQIINFSWPFAMWGMFTWAQLVSDRWAIELFNSTKEVGLFAVLYQLGYYPMSLVSGMVVQIVAPVFYQNAGDASDKQRNLLVERKIWMLTIFTLIIVILVFLIAYFFHDLIFRIFVDKTYSSVSSILPWIVLSGGIFAAAQTLTLNIQSKMKTRLLIFPKIGTAVIGIILNFYFAYLWGIKGVVLASNLFSIVYFIWIVYLTKKETFKKYLLTRCFVRDVRN